MDHTRRILGYNSVPRKNVVIIRCIDKFTELMNLCGVENFHHYIAPGKLWCLEWYCRMFMHLIIIKNYKFFTTN